LIASYARQGHSVAPEIINDVAREFRLDVTSDGDGAGISKTTEMEIRQQTNAMLDLFSRLREPAANGSTSDPEQATQQGEHELHI
jgi:hypothetical protein